MAGLAAELRPWQQSSLPCFAVDVPSGFTATREVLGPPRGDLTVPSPPQAGHLLCRSALAGDEVADIGSRTACSESRHSPCQRPGPWGAAFPGRRSAPQNKRGHAWCRGRHRRAQRRLAGRRGGGDSHRRRPVTIAIPPAALPISRFNADGCRSVSLYDALRESSPTAQDCRAAGRVAEGRPDGGAGLGGARDQPRGLDAAALTRFSIGATNFAAIQPTVPLTPMREFASCLLGATRSHHPGRRMRAARPCCSGTDTVAPSRRSSRYYRECAPELRHGGTGDGLQAGAGARGAMQSPFERLVRRLLHAMRRADAPINRRDLPKRCPADCRCAHEHVNRPLIRPVMLGAIRPVTAGSCRVAAQPFRNRAIGLVTALGAEHCRSPEPQHRHPSRPHWSSCAAPAAIGGAAVPTVSSAAGCP